MLCFTKQALLVYCLTVAVVENCPMVKNCFSLFPKRTEGFYSRFGEDARKNSFEPERRRSLAAENNGTLLLESAVSMHCGTAQGNR